jgi:hypothetical protein
VAAYSAFGGAIPIFDNTSQGIATFVADPTGAAFATIATAGSGLVGAFGVTPTVFMAGELGGAYSAGGAGSQSITASATVAADLAQTARRDLTLAFDNLAQTGSGFSKLTVLVLENNAQIYNQTFSSAASLEATFQHPLDIASLAQPPFGGGTVATFIVSWTLTETTPGDGLYANFALGEATAHRHSFDASGLSDLLIENTAGEVVAGSVRSGTASYTPVAALGPEWGFDGDGNLFGNGSDGFLIENSAGAVDVGVIAGGQTSFRQVAALGSEWSFHGVGDFLAHGNDQFLIENTAGAVVVGEILGGQAHYTQIAALGSEWSFRGAGDFLGGTGDQFLIENTAGAVVVGEVVAGQAIYTAVGALGPEWSFRGTGDFLGDGKSGFLIENTGGAVVLGEVANGQAQYTQIAALGPEWKFVGAGDYFGEGHDQFLVENSSGAVDVGDWFNGQIHYTQVAALGPEWAFH